jgi:hypothetical protein
MGKGKLRGKPSALAKIFCQHSFVEPPPLTQPKNLSSRRRKIRKIILISISLPVLAGLIWYVPFRVSNTKAIRHFEAKAAQRGEPLTLLELATNYPPILDSVNAAVPLLELWVKEDPAYWQAFLAQRRPLPERMKMDVDPIVPILGRDGRAPSRTNQISGVALAAARKFLETKREHLDAITAAIQRPRFRFPIRITEGTQMLLPHLASIKSEAQLLQLQAMVATEDGNVTGAICALTNLVRTGNLLAEEPVLISQLVRIACLLMALDGTQHLLSNRELSTGQLDQLTSLLEQLNLRKSLRVVFLAERAMALSLYDLPADSMSAMTQDDGAGFEVSPTKYRLGMRILTSLGLLGADKRLVLETMDEAIELAALEGPEALQRYESLEKRVFTELVRFPPRQFAMMSISGLGNVPARFATLEARRRAAAVAISVQRFRAANGGRVPESIQNLLAGFLPSIPQDPFDGAPLRYRLLEPGYVVYSVGPDREDNGGKYRPRGGVKGYDDTFGVWR